MNYAIKVISMRSESKICEYAFEATSRKEAKKFLEDFASRIYFKNRDISFSLWEQKVGQICYEPV